MYRIIVDGTAWVDSDGRFEWDLREANTLAEVIESAGFEDIELEAV